MKTTKTTWTFQNADGEQCVGNPTDARGLRLRARCGIAWVNFNDGHGWRQMPFAINTLAARELTARIA